MITSKKVLVYSILGVFFGILLLNVYEFGICKIGFCRNFIEDAIGGFVFHLSVVTLVVSFILLFLSQEFFLSWWKFARVYIPISAILTILSGSGRGGGYISLTTDYESTAWFTAGLFFVISIILIIIKSVHTQRSGWRLAGRVFLVFVGILCALLVLAHIVG